jgi:1-acyl-sn-glycerol-3-phosphate acyltransferase
LETEYRLLKSLSKHIFSQFDLLPYKRRDVQSGIEIKRIVVDLVQKNKKNVLFFPEGTTSLNILDGMKPLKKGGFAHFYENNIPIVPCIIKYSNDFYGLTIEKQVRLLDLFIERPNVFVYCLNVVYPKDFSTYEGFFDCIQKNMEKKINKIK